MRISLASAERRKVRFHEPRRSISLRNCADSGEPDARDPPVRFRKEVNRLGPQHYSLRWRKFTRLVAYGAGATWPISQTEEIPRTRRQELQADFQSSSNLF